jgi:Asp-tRNA(Asn)/Glu-tRNA(Gln) amidotransferase A subunit family amidase
MTEFGISPVGWNAHYGGARNPRDAGRYAGGSSTGSAVAVAAGLLPVAVGFDGGGSVRVPAALTGLYGLAAGFARVPFRTEAPCSMTHAGPFATTARDAELASESCIRDNFERFRPGNR